MRIPSNLAPLVDQGIIQEVVRPLLSGKEAEVWLVVAEGELRVAKVYKEATHRSFKHRAEYTEGRRGRNSRRERAIARRSRYGRAEEEAAWRSAEVDAIYRLHAHGVTVPEPFAFVDGVLVMELVRDPWGQPAPRLVDVSLDEEEALRLFHHLLGEVVKMLAAGLVHGDLSDFNVLLGADGPVIIDFPQAVDAAANRNARKLLVRDVNNLQQFLARYAPHLKAKRYGEELWDLYERGELTPDTQLTGRWRARDRRIDPYGLLAEIEAVEREARRRREARGEAAPPPRERPQAPRKPAQPRPQPKPARARRGQDALDDLDALLIIED